ncbi:MAG: hypothetical protein V2A69_16305 [Pseudomonadota bacterium]
MPALASVAQNTDLKWGWALTLWDGVTAISGDFLARKTIARAMVQTERAICLILAFNKHLLDRSRWKNKHGKYAITEQNFRRFFS